MADLDFHGFGPEPGEGAVHPWLQGRVGRVVHLMGAAMSLALVVGLGFWGYKLLVRDVTGVPVIRAIEGPMRVQPEEPGGNRAAHQGLAVNRIAALGEAAPPPETILLAPRSADLEAEDMAQGLLRTAPELAAAPAPARAPAPAATTDPVEAAILSATTEVMTAEAELSGEGLIEIVPISVPGPSRSPRPRQRPEGFAVAAAALPEASAPGEIDPTSLPEGTKLVQFGAFDSADEARAAWQALAGRFATLMADKARVIEPATAGGRNFFRLRAVGFADAADARRFCAAFVAERADCIPVVAR
ncbi:MAG: SPOR domain-containing protein [Paracoccaceae bacterium]|nr:SPOR domain-containing protein [Paracoccaceae bacterium]